MYLNRVEQSQDNIAKTTVKSRSKTEATSAAAMQVKKQRSQKKPPAFREFQDRFMDQPDYIHRGEILEFETMKQSQSNTRKKVVQGEGKRGSAQVASNFDRQSK